MNPDERMRLVIRLQSLDHLSGFGARHYHTCEGFAAGHPCDECKRYYHRIQRVALEFMLLYMMAETDGEAQGEHPDKG